MIQLKFIICFTNALIKVNHQKCLSYWLLLLFTIFYPPINLSAQIISPFEKNNLQTCTYSECIAFYKQLAKSSKLIQVMESGPSDVSYPIHTIIISENRDFTPLRARRSGKAVLLFNNGIHPGEPDGIDAAMLFARDLVMDSKYATVLKQLVVVIIPIYNIGGSLQRNSDTRSNQNGPEAYGFRGNIQNLDLNRDFIKCDSKNAETFTKIFQYWKPDIFLDSHTTDGADYPYAMTLISSQRQKMQADLGQFMHEQFLPSFTNNMLMQGLETSPYINAEDDPANGIYDFMDSPRFSSGYANLFNTLAFVSESHMLKTHAVRVNAQHILMHSLTEITRQLKKELLQVRLIANNKTNNQKQFPIDWSLQTNRCDSIIYKGYVQEKLKSRVTGFDRIKYNREKPYTIKIPFYNYCEVKRSIDKPYFYIIPAAYKHIINRLKWNGVLLNKITKDTLVDAHFYRILDYKSPNSPYENHFLHSAIKLESIQLKRQYFKGDYIISTQQPNVRFIVETLEPEAPDSYFAWNFFDGILQRKEYFSDYLFEDTAAQILSENNALRTSFEYKKSIDPEFAKNPSAMLAFIYTQSKNNEPYFKIYPVARCF